MKNLLILITAIALSQFAGVVQAADSLEYKLAVIDAGKYVASSDSSIPRVRGILIGLERCYGVPQKRAADMSSRAWQMAKQDGHPLGLIDIMDGALIACDDKSNAQALANALSQYVAVRSATGQTHQQVVHGLLILNYVAKVAMKK